MNVDLLFTEESVRGGWTHVAKITFADLAAVANGTTATFTLDTTAIGDVYGNAAIYLKTPFVFSDATIVSNAFTLGDGGSATTDMSSTETIGTGSYITAKAGTSWVGQTSALTKSVFFTCTTAKNINTATAGELEILWTHVSLLPYAKQ